MTAGELTQLRARAVPPSGSPERQVTGRPVLLYDGVCGLCQFTVRWLLHRDPEGRLLFAALQQPVATEILARHGLDPATTNSAILVTRFNTPQEALALHSDAVLGALTLLGGRWALLARFGRLVPRAMREAAYRWIARNRIRLFGHADLCALPTPAQRDRFLGQ